MKCIGFCEWDKYASASYRSMHTITEEQRETLSHMSLKKRQKEILKEGYLNGEWYSNDIRNVDAGNVPKADIWCFGAPCQDFSIAGTRKGMAGDRSCLVREVFRVLKSLEETDKPEWIIYENVRGMLSSEKGFDFLGILLEMVSCGYDIEYQMFNSKDYGVPQNRDRIYTIGHLRTRGRREILRSETNSRKANIEQIGLLDIPGKEQTRRVYSPNGIAPCLTTMQGGKQEPKVAILGNVNPSGKGMNGNVFSSNALSPTLTTNKGEGIKIAIPCLTPDRTNKRQNGRRFKENGEPMLTLTAQDRHGVAILSHKRTEYGKMIRKQYENHEIKESRHNMTRLEPRTDGISNTITTVQKDNYLYENMRIRKLTPKECFRLQGWTDDYFEKAKFVNSDSKLYKQAGNGVTVNVVYEIANRISQL